jgi:tetratricopeptide (TPR) repeat protein
MPDEAISYLRNASRTAKSSGNPVDAIRHLMHAGDVIYFLDCLQDESSEKIQQNCNEALDLYREAQNIALDFDRKSTLISAALSDIHFRIAITAERLMMGKQFVFDHLKEAVSLDSENIEARYQLASYYFSVEKNLPTAFQNFKMITVQYPNHAAAFYQSCLISAADKKFTEAISLCEKALEVDPNLALAYDLLSDIYIALMQLDEAVKYAEKSLKLFPSFEAFEWRMGLIYFSRKEFEKAAALFEKSAQSKTPSEATLFYLAESLYELKNYPKARKIYEDLLERRVEASKAIPNQNQYMLELIQPLYLRIGICAIMMKDYQAAEDFFEKASAQDISNPQLHYYLAKIYYEKKDMRRAFAATEEALKLKPDYLDAKGFLALLYHEEKNYPEAEKVILEVLQKDPDNLNWQNTYAIILAGSRKFKEALDVLNKIITKDQGFYVAYYNVACVHSLKKSKKEALEWLEKSFQKGFNEWDHIKTDTDLDYIRNDPRFIQLIEKYKKIAEEKEKESKKNE